MTSTNEQMIEKPSCRPRSFLLFCLCVALCIFAGWTVGIITARQNSSLVCKPGEASMDATKFQPFDSVERSLFSYGRRIVAALE